MAKSKKNLAKNIATLFITIILMLALFEISFRFIDPFESINSISNMITRNSIWEERKELQNTKCEFEIINEYNGSNKIYQELRDFDYEFNKTNNTYRILTIGDSFTYGSGVNLCNTWPKQLERKLSNITSKKIEVINGGRNGLETTNELKYLKDRGIKFKPDMVIVGYFLNDATLKASNVLITNRIRKGHVAISNNSMETNSHLLRFLYKTIEKQKLTKSTIKEYHDSYFNNTELWEKNKKALLGLKTFSEKENFTLIVVIFPILYDLKDNTYPFIDIIHTIDSFLKENNIHSHSLLPYFQGYKEKNLWLTINNAHPNEKGHEIASSGIKEILVNNYLPNK